MKEFAEKLQQVEVLVSQEKGPFLLFALMLRDDAPGRWDLLVAAPWMEQDKGAALRYLVPKLQAIASPSEMVKLSRIAIIEKGSPALAAIQKAFHVEHGIAEIRESNFFGLAIKHAYIITSRPADA